MRTVSGSGTVTYQELFVAPYTGCYALNYVASIATVTASGSDGEANSLTILLRINSAGDSNLVSRAASGALQSTPGEVRALDAGDVVTVRSQKGANVSNDPAWSFGMTALFLGDVAVP